MLAWDDLRLVLHVGRAGGLAASAELLGLDPSTVFRRLRAIEARLDTRLFERAGGHYRATAAGERVVAAAAAMEAAALGLEREVAGRDRRLEGRLRVTCSETLAYRLLVPHLAAFRAEHPGIELEILIDNRELSLARRESDVALRAARPAQPDLFGRKLADVAWAFYAARRDGEGRLGGVGDLAGHPLIGWHEAASGVGAADWLARHVPPEAFAYRSNSIVGQMLAARAGIGVALLPCYLGDQEPDLARVFGPMPELVRDLWLVTHADLRRTARVRAFLERIGTALEAQRPLLEGRTRESGCRFWSTGRTGFGVWPVAWSGRGAGA